MYPRRCAEIRRKFFSCKDLFLAQNAPNGFAAFIWYPSVQMFITNVMTLWSTAAKQTKKICDLNFPLAHHRGKLQEKEEFKQYGETAFLNLVLFPN